VERPTAAGRERSLASRARAGARRGAERGSSVGGGMSEELDKHITRKYEDSHKLGKGAYGIVWKATEKKTNKVVALKKVFDAFQNSTDAQRTYREVVYLLQMGHENIVDLMQVLKADNDKDIYLVFEYMETDLHATIRANILEEIHKQYIMYQAFNALKYMHSANIVHRDMKPANLLLNSECLMKVADFGLARTLSDIGSDQIAEGSNKDVMTDYVATRWYRAPEILVGSLHYGYCADLWSLGCIFGEMVNGKPVFSGSSTLNQLEVICELLGEPTKEEQKSFSSEFAENMYSNLALGQAVIERLSNSTLEDRFKEKFPTASPDALDLLMSLLKYTPKDRITNDEGVKHPYCLQFHDETGAENESVTVGKNPEDAEQGFVPEDEREIPVSDNHKLKTGQYREMLYGICKAHAEGKQGPKKMGVKRK